MKGRLYTDHRGRVSVEYEHQVETLIAETVTLEGVIPGIRPRLFRRFVTRPMCNGARQSVGKKGKEGKKRNRSIFRRSINSFRGGSGDFCRADGSFEQVTGRPTGGNRSRICRLVQICVSFEE